MVPGASSHAPDQCLSASIGGSAPRSGLTQALTGLAPAARPKEETRLAEARLKGATRGRGPGSNALVRHGDPAFAWSQKYDWSNRWRRQPKLDRCHFHVHVAKLTSIILGLQEFHYCLAVSPINFCVCNIGASRFFLCNRIS